MTSNILVIGGTGKTGRKVAQRLQAKGQNVRIGSRNASPAFDWQDSTTWLTALEGMNKVYVTFQPDLAVPGAVEAIRAFVNQAQKSKIKKLVLLSGKGEQEAERCEQAIMNSGLDYTIVRASWFNQNFSESFFLDPIRAGHVALPKAEAKVPYVDTDDIADVVVGALMSNQHNSQIYQLTGPQLLTFSEVVREIAQVAGRTIQFTPISMDTYATMLKEQGVPKEYIWLISYLFTEVLGTPGNNIVTDDIEKVLGRKPKSFSQYVAETAITGVWQPQATASV
ncbi:NmrA family NAD(P)-binding protein [Tunicatimonas pelagia]|uniref:NmrA family NAD(P)-binding protein n=1 Tax=Tunicatimonas pelagia TaxID=931531 RepID=UPI00266512A8|nr:NAD(P)H-binding protein [Tunicatimonas pelagia]WKN43672.1 NmrA family NAD(P)-binding protein [Tunicatimonas pelagia]